MCINLNGVKWDLEKGKNWFLFAQSFALKVLIKTTQRVHLNKSNFMQIVKARKLFLELLSRLTIHIQRAASNNPLKEKSSLKENFPPNVVSWMKMRFNGNLCQNKKIISGLLYTLLTWFTNSEIERKSCAKNFHFLLSSETINQTKLFPPRSPSNTKLRWKSVCGRKSEIHRIWFLLMGF